MVEMRVFGLTIDPQTKTPIVILREMDGDVVLPIWVGAWRPWPFPWCSTTSVCPAP